jgi:hypothetical protein
VAPLYIEQKDSEMLLQKALFRNPFTESRKGSFLKWKKENEKLPLAPYRKAQEAL